jgi:hypothetical protein
MYPLLRVHSALNARDCTNAFEPSAWGRITNPITPEFCCQLPYRLPFNLLTYYNAGADMQVMLSSTI